MHTAILIVQCKDNKGIVAAVSQFLYENNGNILAVDQYIDEELGDFFMRAEWELETFAIEKDSILEEFKKM